MKCSALLLIAITICVLTVATPPVHAETELPDLSTTRPVSIDLQDTDIDNFFRIMAEVADLNFVMIDDVSAKITHRAIDIPWEQVLDTVLEEHGAYKVIERNVIKIYRSKAEHHRRAASQKHYFGRLISLDLQQTDLSNALRIIEEVSKRSIKGNDALKGRNKITLRLIDVPWDHALDLMVEKYGCSSSVSSESIDLHCTSDMH